MTPLSRHLKALTLFLLSFYAVARMLISSGAADLSTNILLHATVWVAAAIWLLGSFLEGRFVYRWTRFEIPLFLFTLSGLGSAQVASYKLPALSEALSYASLILSFFLILNVFGPERRHLVLLLLLATYGIIIFDALGQRFFLFDLIRGKAVPRVESEMLQEWSVRLASNEVFATFLYPNTLAAFLAFILPVSMGTAIDLARFKKFVTLPTVGTFLGLLALFFTGSLGGYVSAAVALVFFAALYLWRSQRQRKILARTLLALGVAVLGWMAFCVVMGSLRLPSWIRESRSMEVREVYWDAAVRIIREHPFLGVGLDNFQEHYPQYKSEIQQETTKTHCDYLQTFCEVGLLGFLAFLTFLALTFHRSLEPGEESPSPIATDAQWKAIAAGGASAFPAAYVLEGAFNEIDHTPILAGLLLVLWCAIFIGMRRTISAVFDHGRFLKIGLSAGFIALCVHMSVDFDLHEQGMAVALLMGVALIILGGRRFTEYDLGRAMAATTAVLAFAMAFFLLVLIVPRLSRAEEAKQQARALLESGEQPDRAVTLLTMASESNFLDPEPYEVLAALHHRTWGRLSKKDSESAVRSEVFLTSSIVALENAIRVRPQSAGLHFTLATYHYRYALAYAAYSDQVLPGADRYRSMAHGERIKAHEEMARCLRLYPTRSRGHYWMGKISEALGSLEEARRSYREALRLSALANLSRLHLDGFITAKCRLKVGEHEAARRDLREYIFGVITAYAGSRVWTGDEVKVALEKIRERPEGLHHEEYDEAMTPLVREVLSEMIAEAR